MFYKATEKFTKPTTVRTFQLLRIYYHIDFMIIKKLVYGT